MSVQTMTNDSLFTRNLQTGKTERIDQHDIEFVGWGFCFFVDGEMEAFKAAYLYRHSKHGVRVEFAKGVGRWMVTVFNESAAAAGIDGAR